MSLLTWFSEKSDTCDRCTLNFNAYETKFIVEGREKEKSEIYIEKQSPGFMCRIYHPTAPLVPLDAPWKDGHRYREAGAVEVGSRLDCYFEDNEGPFVCRFGALLLFELTKEGRTAAASRETVGTGRRVEKSDGQRNTPTL